MAEKKATRGQNEEDRKEALHELADQFGEGVGNAEELINANAARRTQELAAINDLPVLQDETNELDLDKLKAPDDGYVLDASVRGSGRTKGTVIVYEDEGGRVHKHLLESTIDDSPRGPRRSSHAKDKKDAEAKDSAS